MKLQQFLKENAFQLDFDYLEKFRDEVGDAIVNFDETLNSKGYKIVDMLAEPDDENYLGVVFSNKVLDIMFEVQIKPGSNSGDEILDLNIELSIADAYTIGAGQTLPSMIKPYRVLNIQPHQEKKFIDGCAEAVKDILDFSEKFHDWYLDVTGEYGKVKLYVDHKSKSDKPSIKALAGEFDIGTQAANVY